MQPMILSQSQFQKPLDGCWLARYHQLVSWRAKSGHCLVPKGSGALGRWVSRQRELRKKNSLSRHHIDTLSSIDFVWDPSEASFQRRIYELLRFRNEHGHLRVPSTFPHLGMWVAKVRTRYRRGDLPRARVKRLNDIGFVWSPDEAEWMEKYNELRYFHAESGTSEVSMTQKQYYCLAFWCSIQRQSFHSGHLAEHRVNLLNELQFKWNSSNAVLDTDSFIALDMHPVESGETLPLRNRTSIQNLSGTESANAGHSFVAPVNSKLSHRTCTSDVWAEGDVAVKNRTASSLCISKPMEKEVEMDSERNRACTSSTVRLPPIQTFFHIVETREQFRSR